MKTHEMPALQRSAGAAAATAQKVFLELNGAQLALLSVTALLAGWTPQTIDTQRLVAGGVCILMFAAFLANIALKVGHFDDKWFRCRALAENVKSAMWYFVMSPAQERTRSEARYLQQIQDIQARLPLAKELAVHRIEGPILTEWMSHVQALSRADKLKVFLERRLADQKKWYQRQARTNALRETQWQWIVFLLEAAAIVIAAEQTWRPGQYGLVGGLAAIGAAFVAWMQTKRYSDLANSYSVAAEDLRRIADSQAAPATDEELTQLVDEVERAVSREHSVWLARRLV